MKLIILVFLLTGCGVEKAHTTGKTKQIKYEVTRYNCDGTIGEVFQPERVKLYNDATIRMTMDDGRKIYLSQVSAKIVEEK
jgi:hypothetical protein